MHRSHWDKEKSEFRKAVGKRLREKRIEAGYDGSKGHTQGDFAKQIGITQGVLSRYESGEVEMPLLMMKRICEALGTSAEDLLGLTKEKTMVNSNSY